MVGVIEAKAALDGIKAAIDLAKGISVLKSDTEIKLAISDILRKLLDAQEATLNDREKMIGLHLENEKLRIKIESDDKWNSERDRYQLTQSPLGAFSYNLKKSAENGDPFHRLCTTCFENGKKSLLHVTVQHSGGEIVHCHTCNTDLTLSPFQTSVTFSDDVYDRF